MAIISERRVPLKCGGYATMRIDDDTFADVPEAEQARRRQYSKDLAQRFLFEQKMKKAKEKV